MRRTLAPFDTDCFPAGDREVLSRTLRADLGTRVREANRRDAQAWARVDSLAGWGAFRAARVEALRRSLGDCLQNDRGCSREVTGVHEGEGYRVENLVYDSRKDVPVSANLYLPSPPRDRMPAILIVHSHHNPKTQDELQDMGGIWARRGCAVMVMDQFGYGERRQHPNGPRQDYRFRYVHGMQLHTIGDSLMGWMVWDVMRGIDVLLGREGVDPERVILMGSVAGGGDPCAVTAALDPRVACAVPFNFGGPQPETVYPLPEDAEETFNYLGGGSWESTRGLRLSGRDGFLPWVIVASIAPRRLVYAHEFSWDRARDPVWKRLQSVFSLHGDPDGLDFTQGAGLLQGRPPEATHCNNIGEVHRRRIHLALRRWFGIAVPDEVPSRRQPADLICLIPRRRDGNPVRPMHDLFREIGSSRAEAFRRTLDDLSPDLRRDALREAWRNLLGEIEPQADPQVKIRDSRELDGIRVERFTLGVGPGIVVPVVLALPGSRGGVRPPVVAGLCQDGKGRFLAERCAEIGELLESGVAVCLPDLRGTGETRPEGSREASSEATAIAATELMLGQTLLGSRLKDLRSVLRHLRTRQDVDLGRIALWGESFAPTNPDGFPDPLIGEGVPPTVSEPLGGLLSLFGALYEEDVRAVVGRGLLAGFQALLKDRFCYIPYDVLVPGALTAGDLGDVAACLAPRPLRLEGPVDGKNCPVNAQHMENVFEETRAAYREAPGALDLCPVLRPDVASWLVSRLLDRS